MAQDNQDYIEYASIWLGADGAAEMDGNRRLVHIPRAEVVRLESYTDPPLNVHGFRSSSASYFWPWRSSAQ